jgi:mannose-1-phosphate guanylyltransferase
MAGVTKTFPPSKTVLKNIYLSFFYGAKIGVLGLNGSGKSSLLKIIAGIDKSFNGEVVALNTKNCYIHSSQQLVATIGIENLIIVTTKDAILIANKNNSQDVKELFENLKKSNSKYCDENPITLRPWGSFEIIDFGKNFKVKKIIVKPFCALSLQKHQKRSEHWVVVKGRAHVIYEDREFILNENESTYISLGKKHRLENKDRESLEIIEIQTGNYLGEDDIVRFNDKYGRDNGSL